MNSRIAIVSVPGLIRAAVALCALAVSGVAWADADADLEKAYKLHRIGDTQAAAGIWRALAAQGQADAQYNLGVIYHYADGVKQDFREALKWYTLAAAQGDIGAQQAIGSMYMRGQGVKQDQRAGMRWMMLDKVAHHHEQMHVAEKWQGQIERAILQDEQKRLELLYVRSQEDDAAIVADLKRRAGLTEDRPSRVAEVR
jgi:uncharacterized protein